MKPILQKRSVTLMFPLYKDKKTVKKMILNSIKILKKVTKNYEIIAVDDGCPDRSGDIVKKFAKKNKKIKVFFHKKNIGYGAAIKTGFKKSKCDCIFAIDGDGEYDVNILPKLLKKLENSDLVITRRYTKKYNKLRNIISWTYNLILRILFKTPFRDISSGSRLLNKKILNKIKIDTNSPFLGAELTIKALYLGYKVSELGIFYYPTNFRSGSSVSLKNILLTICDMINLYFKLCLKKKLIH
jgi:glycosyltransferase involved in cell wall biosynthesis